MARLPRYFVPDQPLHVIQRGNDRQAIFAEEADYLFYLQSLHAAAQRHGLAIHAYVLMTNHVHLLVSPQRSESVGKTMQSVGRRYVRYFNDRYGRTGTRWEGRYRATVLDSEGYLLSCYRYIELNPVRAGMVAHPRDYRWSSYRSHAEGESDPMITDHDLFRRLGRSALARQAAYRALFKSHLGEATLTAIRDATNKGWALGDERFRERIAVLTGRRAAPLPKGRPKHGEEGNGNQEN